MCGFGSFEYVVFGSFEYRKKMNLFENKELRTVRMIKKDEITEEQQSVMKSSCMVVRVIFRVCSLFKAQKFCVQYKEFSVNPY